ncbi:TlpA disulfide reductase family protein [Telluribacter sp.]|jgi:thiol-disulfide isomerase/thioredoxin|uniref:peroxiredoxin family protein n=1 Tax=Telluribacter sp. TaxID=1978767 RepID=UPI002E13256D|nr:TlpA disulfide reductase family protein [Telluribacter sp.]
MKFLIALSLLLLKCIIVYSQNIISSPTKADSILISVYEKLNSLKNIKYDNIRELNYSSENYHNTSKWTIYSDFQTADTIVGLKYQIEDSTSKQVFNGTEKFDLDKKAKTIQLNDNPNKNSFSSLSAFYNSIITLKNVLPLITGDKTAIKVVTDTTINNKVYSLVTINIGKRRIQNLGNGFDAMTTKSNFIYKIIIEKNNYLPFEVLQKNDVNNDFIKTSFSNIETDTNAPSEMSWYYSTYANDYKPLADVSSHKLLSNGSLSPEWKLEAYNKDKTISLSDLKGKVILLDFWIKNCGLCIQSIPHLNELKNKFKDKDFEIISINSYDSKEEVNWFCNKHKTDYSVLLMGKVVAEKYGVSAFPTFFIIDKTGKIIYSKAGFNASVQTEVEQVIQKAL